MDYGDPWLIMEIHNYGVLSPLAIHMYVQNSLYEGVAHGIWYTGRFLFSIKATPATVTKEAKFPCWGKVILYWQQINLF